MAELEQLINEVVAATGTAPPDLLAADSPALTIVSDDPLYLIGLIGGKDVGKSSLINALVGLPISAASAAGPGTQQVIAYAHERMSAQLEPILSSAVPGKFSIITHNNAALSRQVLLDLPDIDSVYADHIDTTRRMLRHMLFPIWLQSIEKYADQQPQRLLARVAEGNDPRNFLFAINKIDLLIDRDGEPAARELCDDFAQRIARTLSLRESPRIYRLSAARPEKYDLPELRQRLSREASRDEVTQSRQYASQRRTRTLLHWLEAQNLSAKAEQAQRTFADAEQFVADRLTAPLLESQIPSLTDGPGHRAQLIEPMVRRRLLRWPIVGAINAAMSPVIAFAHRSLASAPAARSIDACLTIDDIPLADRIAATFAHLHRIHPSIASQAAGANLWEPAAASLAGADLRNRLRGAASRQAQAILDRGAGTSGIVAPLWRILLTIGAIVWFPIAQPILHAFLSAISINSWGDFGRLVVQVLGASHLLQAGAFLLIWFGVLWLLLRWFAQRKGEHLLQRWQQQQSDDEQFSLVAQVMQWSDELLAPLRRECTRISDLAQREKQLRTAAKAEREAA